MLGVVSLVATIGVMKNVNLQFENERITEIFIFCIKSFVWIILYAILLFITHTLSIKDKKIITKYD